MNISLFYVPSLSRNEVRAALPDTVFFIPCGLPESNEGFAAAAQLNRHALQTAILEALPLKPAEACAALQDMLRLGEDYGADGLSRRLAARGSESFRNRRQSVSEEFADLDAFVETGRMPEPVIGSHVPQWRQSVAREEEKTRLIQQAMLDCQKTLLLIHSLEGRSREMRQLETRLARAEKAFHDSFEEEVSSDLVVAPTADDAADLSGSAGANALDWRIMVDAALPFLPENAALFTNDTAMALDLRESGMLQPLPEDRATLLAGCSDSLVSGLLYLNLPAWRLVGRRGPMAERPWLERNVELFAARPTGGWVTHASSARD